MTESITNKITGFIRRNWLMLLIMLVYLSIQMMDVNTLPGHDPAAYFKESLRFVDAFKESGLAALPKLAFVRHPSYGYALIMVLPQFLFYGSVAAMNITTFILCLSALWCVYKLCVIMFDGLCNTRKEAALTAGLVGFCPLIFSSSIHTHLDLGSMIFLSWFLYAFFSKKRVFTVVSGILLIFSKETGILLYLAFGLALLIFVFPKEFPSQKKFGWFVPAVKKYYSLFVPVLVFAVYYILNRGFSWGGGITTTAGTVELNFFTVNLRYIVYKTLHFFIFNWNWVITLFLFALFGIVLKRFGWKKISLVAKCLVFVMLIFYLFNALYYTHVIPRYWMPFQLMFVPVGAYFLLLVFPSGKLRATLIGCWLAVYIVGNYTMFDPVTLRFSQKFNYGDKQFVYIEYGPTEFCSQTIYNRQYLMQERLYKQLYKQTEASADQQWIGSHGSWTCNIDGNAVGRIPLYVDAQTMERTFINKGVEVNYTEVSAQTLEDPNYLLPQNAKWIRFTFTPTEAAELIESVYDIGECVRVEQFGYYFDVYDCVLKE